MFLGGISKVSRCFNLITGRLSSTMSEQKMFRKPRYDGRSKKRKWEERRTDKGESLDLPKKEKVEDRIKKRKYVLLMGYSGADYFGMQRNPTTKTIEEELFKALLNTQHISEDAFNQIQTIQFQRAARTDKGVSAARQVVSIKLPEVVDVEKINENLPEVIRVFGCKRVTKGFNSKSQCDARTYFYMLPTVAFSKYGDTVSMEEHRLSEATRETINGLLSRYIGTKNYHNFTSKRLPGDPSCKRFMMSFVCEEPIIRKNVEFAVLKVKGQSFMLHQIRKMIGLTIAIMRGHTTEDSFTRAFTQDKLNVPKAPGLGLVLDFVHYDRYNQRYGTDGIHETLDWADSEETVLSFKEKYIYPTIIDTEINERSMMEWLDKLTGHSYEIIDEDDKNDDENNRDSDDEGNGDNDDKDEENAKKSENLGVENSDCTKKIETELLQVDNSEQNKQDVKGQGNSDEAQKSVPVNT